MQCAPTARITSGRRTACHSVIRASVLVVWSRLVGSLRIGDQNELRGIDLDSGVYRALLQLARQGCEIRVALFTQFRP